MYALFGLSALALLSCSGEKKNASTEVENEIKLSSIEGIAATGLAMGYATWEVVTASGVRVAQGTTDDFGRFKANVDTTVLREDLPWLVRVFGASDTLTSLLELEEEQDTLFGLVNPITDYVARKLLGPAVQDPYAGYRPPDFHTVDSIGQHVVNEVFGNGFIWNDFHGDRHFRPAVLRPETNYIPSSHDMLLHSLGGEASRLGITRDQLLDSLYHDSGFTAMGEKDFRLDLAANMALYGIPPDSAQPQLRSWQESQGIQDTTIDSYYLKMWEYGHGKEEDGPAGPQDPLSIAMQAANWGMQHAAQTYPEPELTQARNNFNPGMVIISDLLYPIAQSGASYNRVQRLADDLGMVLSALIPLVWNLDSLATKALVQRVLEEYILLQPEDTMIHPDAIRAEVNAKWQTNTPAFWANPLRTTQIVRPKP